jgi:hypothetical protein
VTQRRRVLVAMSNGFLAALAILAVVLLTAERDPVVSINGGHVLSRH